MSRLRSGIALAVAALSCPVGGVAVAQLVGTVRSVAGPVPSALVEAAGPDPESTVRRTTTSSQGRFSLSLPAGRHRLIVRAIGFHPDTSTVEVPSGGAVPDRQILLLRRAFSLPDVVVAAGQKDCRVGSAARPVVLQMLGVVEDAAAVMQDALARSNRRFVAEWSRQVYRIVDGQDALVDSLSGRRIVSAWPVVAPDSLLALEHGFSWREEGPEGETRQWFGLDLEAVLSDWFARTHCLWVEVETDVGEVRLRFEPYKTKWVDVAGALVFNSEDWTLARLEYEFVQIPFGTPRGLPHGSMTFTHDPTGVWHPSAWKLRVPVERPIQGVFRPTPGRRIVPEPLPRPETGGYVLEAGQVVEVTSLEPSPPPR